MRTRSLPSIRRTTSLTALVDVVFLLLLFFMLASSFSRFSEIDVTLGGSGAPDMPVAELANVLLTVDADRRFAVNGFAVAADTLAETLRDLGSAETQRILLRPTTRATAQDIITALETARGARAGDVVLVH
ncbi:ExbD/TolR family protein [Microbaculum marinisediminis]|uniref:Biopolymer transporter ExbD n=1 Tax=Microbaculum marinisediminis TaxID=2931392 RepID=A0AAW5R5M3_9HYPH|nr:biopolymer transporter ExbD [Microbaculum sp. A6E488]MCT8974412.1 biopolymer transporter ExbD [Microbaculum sp. A6E488]